MPRNAEKLTKRLRLGVAAVDQLRPIEIERHLGALTIEVDRSATLKLIGGPRLCGVPHPDGPRSTYQMSLSFGGPVPASGIGALK